MATISSDRKSFPKRLGNAAINLLLVLGAVVVALLVGEAALRLVPPRGFVDLPSDLLIPHPTLGRVMRPNYGPVEKVTSELSFQVQTNSYGLRDVEIGPKAPGVIRFLVLGDSFTWGDGVNVDDTYVKQLEKLLNGRCGRARSPAYEVINAGVPEWGPAQMWLYLKDYGVRFQPDLVLLDVCDLDIYRNGPYLATVFDSPSLPSRPSSGVPPRSHLSSLKIWLTQHSRLYNIAAVYAVHSPVLNDWLQKTGLRAEKPREFLSADLGYTERVLKENEQIMEMMKDFSKRRGIRFMAAYIPTASQVKAIAERKMTDARVAQMMRRVFRDAPESLVNLSSGFAMASDQGTLYYAWDGHWTAKGHRLAAEILWPSVSKLSGGCQASMPSGTGARSGGVPADLARGAAAQIIATGQSIER